MKRKLLIAILCLSSINYLFGQEKMVIDMPFSGNTYYGRYSEEVESLSELPSVIQFNLDGYIFRILGSMSDSVTFSRGQIIDLERKFKTDSVTYEYGWIVPRYDLHFSLKDKSIGILNYDLQLRLDKFGQILYSNYPKEKYSDKNRFKNRADIEKFALNQAEAKGFETTDYNVEFKYSQQRDELCWVFKFPKKVEKNRQEYDVFEIPWNSIEIIEEYQISTSTLY